MALLARLFKSYKGPAVGMCLVLAGFSSLVAWLGGLEQLELKTIDQRVQVCDMVRRVLGLHRTPGELVLVGITQSSVDPVLTPQTDRWNSGRWLTRELYIRGFDALANVWKPSAVGVDILFPRARQEFNEENLDQHLLRVVTAARAAPSARPLSHADLVARVEIEGNNDLAAWLWTSEADGAPPFVFAYNFDYSTLSGGATSDTADAAGRWASVPAEYVDELLLKNALPAECFEGPAPRQPLPDGLNMPPLALVRTPATFGFINAPRDPDGNLRRMPMVLAFRDPRGSGPVRYAPSLTLQLLLRHLGVTDPAAIRVRWGHEIVVTGPHRTLRIPVDGQGNLFLNFRHTTRDYPFVSYIDTVLYAPIRLADRPPAGVSPAAWGERREAARDIEDHLRGRIAIIGTTFTGNTDLINVALEANAPGALGHLTALENILSGHTLPPPTGPRGTALILFSLALLLSLAAILLEQRAWLVTWLLVTLAYLFLTGAGIWFDAFVWPVLPPLLFLLLGGMGTILIYYLTEARDKLQVRKMFSTMVSPELLDYLAEHPAEALQGKKVTATIMFSDVAGFTTISERLGVDALRDLFLDYLSPMTDTIQKHRGLVDKYLGDGIMAVWGAPLDNPAHAADACRAALEQQREVLRLSSLVREKYGVTLEVRMGLNTGLVSAGNMGSARKQQYTVMGDAVNLAARLEPANKDYGTLIIIGEETHALVRDRFHTRCLDKLVVKGKSSAVAIHELIAESTPDTPLPEWARLHNEAIHLCWQRQWQASLALWERVLQLRPGDLAAQLLLNRTRGFLSDPPPDSWQGESWRKQKD